MIKEKNSQIQNLHQNLINTPIKQITEKRTKQIKDIHQATIKEVNR